MGCCKIRKEVGSLTKTIQECKYNVLYEEINTKLINSGIEPHLHTGIENLVGHNR